VATAFMLAVTCSATTLAQSLVITNLSRFLADHRLTSESERRQLGHSAPKKRALRRGGLTLHRAVRRENLVRAQIPPARRARSSQRAVLRVIAGLT
jgi:hypothetical protein